MIIRVPKKCEAHMKSVEVIFYTLLKRENHSLHLYTCAKTSSAKRDTLASNMPISTVCTFLSKPCNLKSCLILSESKSPSPNLQAG